ncbi:MAG: hypothetical protein ACOCZ4_02265 [Bacteroidota bacterium]
MEDAAHKILKSNQFWLSLDNAAKIFPATLSEETTTVFRLKVVFNQPVKIKPLMKAVSLVEKRFPYYKVQLKKGFFWYYLEHIPYRFPVEVDDKPPCRRFPKNHLLLRILVKNNELSVEFSHILADGGGAFQFFKTLLILYSEKCGATIPEDFEFCRPDDEISEEEYEDAYKRYFKEDIPPMVKKSKAFHLPYALNPSPRFEMTNAIISIEKVRARAKERNVSITDYIAGIYLYALQEIYEELNSFSRFKKYKFIRLQVPIDLRNIFPSKTMRNFSLFVMPEIDLRLGHYTFDEIIRRVYHQMRLETDEKLISKNISRNVGSEKKIYIKSIPLVLKSLILRMKFYSLGASQYSGVVTNLGRVKLPPETEDMIDYFVITAPPPNKMLKVNCAIIGFKDKLTLSFGNITKSKELEEKIFKFLKDEGIEVNLET